MRFGCAAAAAAVVMVAAGLVVVLPASTARAQDQPSADEMDKKYQDALAQLKAAQDRKNELATENEQLKARLAELEKQLNDRNREAAEYARQTFFLRSHYASWQAFLERHPQLANRWKVFLETDLLSPIAMSDLLDPIGSSSAEDDLPALPATTQRGSSDMATGDGAGDK
jgi:hypothetical protein